VQPADRQALREAKALLEHPGFAARVTHMVGRPFEKSLEFLPADFQTVVHGATHKALGRALDVAVSTLDAGPGRRAANLFHKAAATLSGGAGGAFGLHALLLELPVTTTLMLRSIADIARSEGESLGEVHARLACLEVFALGGPGSGDDAAETGYYAVRAVLAQNIADAAAYLLRKGVAEKEAPVLVRLLASIASRFGIVVSEKAAAQLVPVIGGIGGATINLVFMDHFQRMAQGHFTVRRLERSYGADVVRQEYESL